MNVEKMKAIVTEGLPHYFDADTVRFFGSRIPDHTPREVGGCIVFVSSEQCGGSPRMYSVNVYNVAEEDMGKDAQGFQGYETLDEALVALDCYRAPRE